MLAAGLVLPFFLVDVPPVLDYPNHLARFFVLAYPHDPILSRFYAPNWHITPNLGFDPVAMLLVRVLPVHVAGRLVLAVALLAPPAGALAYNRAAFGKPDWWALAVTLAAYNGIFFLGFLNFQLAIGLSFAAAGLWLSLRRRGRTALAVVAGAIVSMLLFLCHIFGVLLFGLLITCQEISLSGAAHDVKRLRHAALAVFLALLPAMALYRASALSGAGLAIWGWDGPHKLWNLFSPFMVYGKALTLLTGAAVFATLVLCWRGADFAPGTRTVLAVLALAYLAAPATLKGGSFVDMRLALMMGLLLFAGIRFRIAPHRANWLALGAALLLAARIAFTASVWMDHRRDLSDFRAAIAHVEPGARVLVARGRIDANSPVMGRRLPDTVPLDTHLAALLVIEHRAFWPFLFADPVQQTVVVRPPYDSIAAPLTDPPPLWMLRWPAPPRLLALLPYLRNWPQRFDYLLVTDPGTAFALPGFTPLYASNYVRLYRLRR